MGLFINILFALLFVAFVYFYFKQSFTLTFLYGLVFFQAFSVIPSLIYLEQGVFINEQGRQSFFTGATITCVLYFIFTFVLIAMAFKSFNKRSLPVVVFTFKGKKLDVYLLFVIIIGVQLVLLINAAFSPLPVFNENITRFTYWSSSKFPFLNTLFGNTAMFLPFAIGLLFTRNYKYFSIFMLLVFFGYNFAIGQKFSPIIQGTFSFLLPIVFNKRNDLKKLAKKAALPILLIGTILVGIMYQITYTKYEKTNPFADVKIYDPNEAMLYRIFGLQGHLFWGSTEKYLVGNDDPKSFNPAQLLYGMPVMMEDFAKNKKDVLNANAAGGYNFTNAYPAILFKIFPLSLALVMHTFLAVFFLALMGWILKELMIGKGYLLSVVAYQLFNWVIYAFVMGYFYKLYFSIFFMVVYGLYIHLRKKRLSYEVS